MKQVPLFLKYQLLGAALVWMLTSACSAQFQKTISLNQTLFVANSSGTVSSYKIENKTGVLFKSSEISISAIPVDMAFQSSSKSLYIVDGQAGGGIKHISVNSKSGVMQLSDSLASATTSNLASQGLVNLDGSLLYLFSGNISPIEVYSLDATTGSMTYIRNESSTLRYRGLIASTGNTIFVSDGQNGIRACGLDSSTGRISGTCSSLFGNKGFFILNKDEGSCLSAYSSSTSITQSVFIDTAYTNIATRLALGVGAVGNMLLHPTGSFLYAQNPNTGTLSLLVMNNNALTIVGATYTTSSGGSANGLAITQDGKYLFASDTSGNSILTYKIDTNTGELSYVTNTAFSRPSVMGLF